MSNNQTSTPDLSTLDREALARMVGQLEAQLTTARIRIAEAEAAHTETLNEGDRLRAQLAAARAEVERLKADMAFCGIGYNEDGELALSMKPYNAFVRSKADETVAAESEQLKARVDHLTQELIQDKALALRAALAQVEAERDKANAKLTTTSSDKANANLTANIYVGIFLDIIKALDMTPDKSGPLETADKVLKTIARRQAAAQDAYEQAARFLDQRHALISADAIRALAAAEAGEEKEKTSND
jgi:hypothetical protein